MNKEQGIEMWSKLYGRPISEEEYREICENLYNFFSFLNELDKRKNESDKQPKPSDLR